MQYSLLFLAAAGAFAPVFAAPVGDLGGITNAVGNIGSSVGGPSVNRVAGITQDIPKQAFHDDEAEIPEDIEELEFIEDVIPEAGEDVSAQKKRQLGGLGGLGAVTELLGGVTGGLGGGKVGRRGTEKEALGGAADTVKGVKDKLPAGAAVEPAKAIKDKLPKGPVGSIAEKLAAMGGAKETVSSLTGKLPVRDVSE
ncbi:hypothetical protein TWF106_006658 [Orbilia oligospora]|uniref:Uncharacterized protein n=1 Tax=Orbilia oligospora TaxID=2813651 RepID=A0A6G1M4J3_ORBOL|nr:hypothetical protein TWF788_002124 [Orbilia oligospora]KAF3201029.1 hypothetical protein TWF679_000516 [Orbilia oligospora]KAF3211627.1 hypothetical protein TWF191_010705 [Orbilia oligospora]KAF3220598.1 hypothetical protein TWF106_006658 [Orbilia oligospora]KAF3243449.1 hypothetical protein TWF192_008356 [Orbilia oligospora]